MTNREKNWGVVVIAVVGALGWQKTQSEQKRVEVHLEHQVRAIRQRVEESRALMAQARDDLASFGEAYADNLPEIDAWLAAHPRAGRE